MENVENHEETFLEERNSSVFETFTDVFKNRCGWRFKNTLNYKEVAELCFEEYRHDVELKLKHTEEYRHDVELKLKRENDDDTEKK